MHPLVVRPAKPPTGVYTRDKNPWVTSNHDPAQASFPVHRVRWRRQLHRSFYTRLYPRASRSFLPPLVEIRYTSIFAGLAQWFMVAPFKVYRALQYFARFYAWLLISSNNKADAAKWNALKSHLALGRKCVLRLFPSSQSVLTSPTHSAEVGQTGRTPASRVACHPDCWSSGRTTHDRRATSGILPLSHL